MVRPIKPSEVVKVVPSFMIEIFNELIQENWDGNSSTFKLDQAMQKLKSKDPGVANVAYDKRYFDVESIYRKEGWKVEFDKPGYNEDYDAFFVFSK